MAARTFPYSAFLRGPSQVLASLDNADVILERRDEENLILMRAGRAQAALDGLRVAARSLSLLAARYPELAEEVLAEELPWLHWLPENEQVQCVRELLADLRAGVETGEFLPFARNLVSWRSTAEVWSDPELAHDLLSPSPGDGPEIPRPGGPE
ncbi:hypothetical protein [Nocardia blacklockiae]|uniref:hypothetical protein n=1 Tax=Nocardia blacklockiae TaxID=480036 RepID=UPI00189601F7|nr:hypothetical protein [Nocardia blacklockiae]MBF6174267.1 hypothetical protein [Nocardia blacklockiae]